jgi:hypothetical protein
LVNTALGKIISKKKIVRGVKIKETGFFVQTINQRLSQRIKKSAEDHRKRKCFFYFCRKIIDGKTQIYRS